jgi:hypothetical protein
VAGERRSIDSARHRISFDRDGEVLSYGLVSPWRFVDGTVAFGLSPESLVIESSQPRGLNLASLFSRFQLGVQTRNEAVCASADADRERHGASWYLGVIRSS